MTYAVDRLVLVPDDIDLSRSPLAGHLGAETYCLGAFNPALMRLPNGNLLMMVRIAEALRTPVFDDHIHNIRWNDGGYVLDAWPLTQVDASDPRKFRINRFDWTVMALTSLSWLLPVELTPDGLAVVAHHYDKAIHPHADFQMFGVEDARISRVGTGNDGRWLMTTCAVSAERHSTTLYSSDDGLYWRFEDIVLDHQNKDMVIFQGLIGDTYWAQTRPLGHHWFAYPPDSEWRPGPAINLATSPDALHWKPHRGPGIRARADSGLGGRMGAGTPPILTDQGWLSLWHAVEIKGVVGIYRTFWSLLDRDDPGRVVHECTDPVLEPNAALTEPLRHQMYVDDVVFTTGMVDAGDHYVVASGEADLACRITHVPKSVFGLT